ncbi:MAG: PAS domain S-box protein [Magnetospirillum sp.]
MRIFPIDNGVEVKAFLDAVYNSQAVIEFSMDGMVLDANANFLKVMGYELSEIRGRHHSMFVEPAYRDSDAYGRFWEKLKRGEADTAQYKRLGKGGHEVWIEASYNPIRDRNGTLCKVVKFAVDVTEQKMHLADLSGTVDAIDRSQAMISFTLDGTILDANQNFLDTMGYGLAEILGKHHSMFVDAEYGASLDYRDFWAALRHGRFQRSQFRRFGKDGREVWIEASYNPILDPAGKPYKVIKVATNITEQVALLNKLKDLIDVNFTEIDASLHVVNDCSASTAQAVAMASANVQAVASAAEEMAASITEISSSMTKSQEASDRASQQIVEAGGATQKLVDVAAAMSGIVSMIQNIASKINLLSLNAAIESARAGDAGRGFAVVANEVKQLANQAAHATANIGREIAGVQSVANEVVGTLEGIRGAISQVQNYVEATASAVEEQSAVTRDMSMNMQSAAGTVETISGNITEITGALVQVEQAVGKTKDAAHVLAR